MLRAPRSLQISLRIIAGGQLALNPDWQGSNVRMWFWRLWQNSRDGGELRWQGRGWEPLQAGSLYLIPSGHAFAWRCRAATPGIHRSLHFELDPATDLRLGRCCPQPLRLPQDPALALLATRLGSAAGVWDQALTHAALAALLQQLPSAVRHELDQAERDRARLEPALRLIAREHRQPLNVARLAAACGLGADRFARLFKAAVGEAPGRHLLRVRLAAAARELAASERRIEDIAERCGFADRFYFSRQFARHYGSAPGRYRRAAQAGWTLVGDAHHEPA